MIYEDTEYFVQLPTDLMLCEDFTLLQKVLYADISALTHQRGYCFASNAYLAERHNKEVSHISKQISALVSGGWLFVLDNKGGNCTAGKRKLFTRPTYIKYAETVGIDTTNLKSKVVKNHTLDDLKVVKNHTHNNISKSISKQESTKVDSSLREQDLKHSVDTTVQKKRKALSQPKASVDKAVTKEPLVSKAVRLDTIEILEYWNSFDSLTTHGIARKRNISPLHKQIQAVQKFDCQLYKILNGRFYKGFTTLSVGIRSKKSTKYDIKKAIKRLALAASHEYGVYKKRPRIDCLFHNDRATLGSGKNRHLHLYPFLHFMSNDPVSIADTPTRKKTEYDILVQRTLDGLVSSKTVNDKEYNQAVVQIEKAMVFIKKVSNGNFAENRMRLPKMIIDSMIEDGKTLNVQNLPLGVYNLERYMRKRLMIK